MNPKRLKYRSVYIIGAVILVLLFVQVFLYGNFFNELRVGTNEINDLSRIRGSIQRYAKLELSGVNSGNLELEIYIDGLITRNMSDPTTSHPNQVSTYYDMKTLNLKWDELKLIVKDYHNDPSEEHLTAAINKSEECWKVADANVIRQQFIVDRTAAYYKYFTVTFGANLLAIILAMLFYKRFVHNSLAATAIHDSLTGIFNRGYFSEYLKHEIARSIRKQRAFSLIMLDIDRFKHVNDTYGHHRGDYALKTLAEVILRCKRNADVLARIGGEEFIILLPDTELSDAAQLAERVRKSVENYSFEEIGRLTISLGVTQFIPADSSESILKRVDSAMYLAKENGRNRSEVIGGEES